jgi:hypothetical protein
MYRGYIKVWRKIADAGWLKNHKLCAFWLWCMIKASHKELDQIVGSQTVHLIPGDFIFGRKKAAVELDMSEQEIRTILIFLKKSKNLTIKSTNKFSIISIINWNTYQGEEIEINQQINTPLTSNQPTTNQPLTTNKNEKHLKHLKNTYTSDFLSFWDVYPRKVGKDAAWKAWKNRNGSLPEINIIITAIENQKNSDQWLKDSGQYIPNPATWINQGRWEDELVGEVNQAEANHKWAIRRQKELDAEDKNNEIT